LEHSGVLRNPTKLEASSVRTFASLLCLHEAQRTRAARSDARNNMIAINGGGIKRTEWQRRFVVPAFDSHILIPPMVRP
jgi:hypothetical protein